MLTSFLIMLINLISLSAIMVSDLSGVFKGQLRVSERQLQKSHEDAGIRASDVHRQRFEFLYVMIFLINYTNIAPLGLLIEMD